MNMTGNILIVRSGVDMHQNNQHSYQASHNLPRNKRGWKIKLQSFVHLFMKLPVKPTLKKMYCMLIKTMKYCFKLCNPGLQPWSHNTEALGSLVGHSDTQGTPSHCRLLFEAHQSTSHTHRPPSGISYAVLLPSQGATHTLVLHLPLGSLTLDTYTGDYMWSPWAEIS